MSRPSRDEIMESAEDDDGRGWCLACGEEADHYCEPDLTDATCEHCGKDKVTSAMMMLVMGY
jgi:Zn finger protein HypA/HybF involved in hydrogenase expression